MWENYWLGKKLKKHQRNQPWAARFVENILNTRETEDTLQKTTCAEHSEVAQFVENKLGLQLGQAQYYLLALSKLVNRYVYASVRSI